MRRLLSIVMLAAVWTAGAQGTSEAILGYTSTSDILVNNGTAGWTFQVTNTVTVIELGCLANFFPKNPAATEVQVGLWDLNGLLKASATITPTNTLVEASLYGSVNPVLIGPGQTYHIGVYYPGFFGINDAAAGSVTASPGIVSLTAAYTAGGFVSPLEVSDSAGAPYLGPNFRYNPVPEPSSTVLLALGALLLAARRKHWPR